MDVSDAIYILDKHNEIAKINVAKRGTPKKCLFFYDYEAKCVNEGQSEIQWTFQLFWHLLYIFYYRVGHVGGPACS